MSGSERGQNMRIIRNGCTDPYFNLASEEYLCDSTDGDVFMLWQNEKTVVIGRNQNAWAQIDLAYANENSIAAVRRLTGGGAVFHDKGNVNFTFITDRGGDGIDFAAFASPIIRFLAECGLDASLGGRNDILAHDVKISGNAQCVRRRADGRERLLHHGTLLYSADLSLLSRVLAPDREKLISKGIDSVKSRVGNIRDMLPELASVSAEGFMEMLIEYATREYGVPSSDLTDGERASISQLAREKYETWEWNFGSSPAFEDERSRRFPFGRVTVSFNVEKGVFREVRISGDFFGSADASSLERALVGCPVERRLMALRLQELGGVDDYIHGCSDKDLLELFFGEKSKKREGK